MSFAYVDAFINPNNKSSGLSITGTVGSVVDVPAGVLAIVNVAMDNVQTTDSTATDITVTDSKSNNYTRVQEFVNGQGSAAAGVHTAMFYAIITTPLVTGVDTVTAARGSTNVTAKAMCGIYFSIGVGASVQVDDVTNRADDAGSVGALVLSGLANIEHLFVSAGAAESNGFGTGYTPANYTNPVFAVTSGSSADTNVGSRVDYRILTATGDTFDPAPTGSRDWAHVYAAFSEVGGGASIAPIANAQYRRRRAA